MRFTTLGAFASITLVGATNEENLEQLVIDKLRENTPKIDAQINTLVPAEFAFDDVSFNKKEYGLFNIAYGYDAGLTRIDHANTLSIDFDGVDLESTEESVTVTVGVKGKFGTDLRLHGNARGYCGALSVGGDIHASLQDLTISTTMAVKLFLSDEDNLKIDFHVDQFKLSNLDIEAIDFEWHLFGKKLWGWFDNMLDGLLNGVLHLVEGIKPSLADSILNKINELVYTQVNDKAAEMSPEAFKLLMSKAHEYLQKRRMLQSVSSEYVHHEEDQQPDEDVPQEFKDQFKLRMLQGSVTSNYAHYEEDKQPDVDVPEEVKNQFKRLRA